MVSGERRGGVAESGCKYAFIPFLECVVLRKEQSRAETKVCRCSPSQGTGCATEVTTVCLCPLRDRLCYWGQECDRK